SSDWFWWFGDYHPAASVAAFDRLFRANLARVYALLGLPVPVALNVPVSLGNTSSVQRGAIMRSTV
ncbi:MAG TPA: glycoside hydrolase, partial [Casimicrobiaceae bacterium]|nr:glycoside hydrolase [Casimicrobiaceae bacterium]